MQSTHTHTLTAHSYVTTLSWRMETSKIVAPVTEVFWCIEMCAVAHPLALQRLLAETLLQINIEDHVQH